MSEKSVNQTVNIVCMKWGTLYSSEYVNRLYGMVQRNLHRPFNFYCITDSGAGIRDEVLIRDMPAFTMFPSARGPWQKLLMFQRDLFDIRGKTMFLDLDIIIVGPLDRFFTYSDKFAVRHEFDKRKENQPFGNTSMYVFEAGRYPEIYENYLKNRETIHKRYWTAEQEYVTRTLYELGEIEFLPNEWVISFKEHCLPSWPLRWWKTPQLPAGASILSFHGRPLPEDAIAGKWPLEGKPFWKALYKHTKPCHWLEDYWRP
jgi:hypothetical protein